jgi:hypothetical protein
METQENKCTPCITAICTRNKIKVISIDLADLRRGLAAARLLGSNPAGGMDVCILRVLCVVR